MSGALSDTPSDKTDNLLLYTVEGALAFPPYGNSFDFADTLHHASYKNCTDDFFVIPKNTPLMNMIIASIQSRVYVDNS